MAARILRPWLLEASALPAAAGGSAWAPVGAQVVMSGELEAMADSLFSNSVPALWAKKAYPSLKPLAAWVDDLAARLWERSAEVVGLFDEVYA